MNAARGPTRSRCRPQGNDVWTARVHAPRAGALPLHGHRVGRSLRVLAQGARAARGARRHSRRLAGGSALIAATAARAGDADARVLEDWAGTLAREREAGLDRGRGLAQGARARSRARAPDAAPCGPEPRRLGRPGDFRGPQARGLQQLVRAVPALRRVAAGAARQLQGRRGAPALHRRDGLRCRVLPAHPADRTREPQGARTTRSRRSPTMSAAPGRSAPRRAATRRFCRSSARSRISGTWWPRRASSAWRSRSTSLSNARPITPTCARIPQWFKHRPDGSVQYAENPPKKYQDIYPFDFETDGLARSVGGAEEHRRLLDRAGRPHISRRQSAHQAVCVLGMADRRDRSARIPT